MNPFRMPALIVACLVLAPVLAGCLERAGPDHREQGLPTCEVHARWEISSDAGRRSPEVQPLALADRNWTNDTRTVRLREYDPSNSSPLRERWSPWEMSWTPGNLTVISGRPVNATLRIVPVGPTAGPGSLRPLDWFAFASGEARVNVSPNGSTFEVILLPVPPASEPHWAFEMYYQNLSHPVDPRYGPLRSQQVLIPAPPIGRAPVEDYTFVPTFACNNPVDVPEGLSVHVDGANLSVLFSHSPRMMDCGQALYPAGNFTLHGANGTRTLIGIVYSSGGGDVCSGDTLLTLRAQATLSGLSPGELRVVVYHSRPPEHKWAGPLVGWDVTERMVTVPG